MMHTGAKTGMRPLTKRAYKKGGKVVGYCEGGEAKKHAGRKPRKSGGRTMVSDLINRNAKKANQYRDGGDAHVGGLKRGGRAHKLYGGSFTKRGEAGTPLPYGAMKKGGKIHRRKRADGGPLYDFTGSEIYDPSMGTGNAARDYARMNPPRAQAPAYSSANTTQSGINYSDMSFEGARDLARVRAANAGPQSFQWRGTEYPLDASAPVPAAAPAPARARGISKAPIPDMSGPDYKASPPPVFVGEEARAFEPDNFPMSRGGRWARQFQSWLRGEGRSSRRGGDFSGGYAATAGYKRGGKVHEDIAADKKLIKKAIRQHDEHMHEGKHEELHLKKGGKAKWIAGAIKHPGALHKSLHVKEGEKIPAKKLAKAAHSDNPKLAKRARLAQTLKRMHKDGGGWTGEGDTVTDLDRQRRAENDMAYQQGMRRLLKTTPPNTSKGPEPHKKGGKAESAKYNYLGGTRPTGGRIAKKDGGRTKGKTNIIIAINPQQGGRGMMQPSGMPPMGPTPRPGGAAPVAPPTAPMPMLPGMGNLPPGAMPPGGVMPGAGMMPPGLMPRKSGGRVYRSYEDMDAGAGSGLGRLEKTQIQSRK